MVPNDLTTFGFITNLLLRGTPGPVGSFFGGTWAMQNCFTVRPKYSPHVENHMLQNAGERPCKSRGEPKLLAEETKACVP